MRDWPGRARAERLRQWPTLAYVAERVAEATALEALLIIGSFATRTADDASDLDLIAAVREGRFREAWEQRRELDPPDALVAWDDARSDLEREIAGRKFLSRDVVKAEVTFATASSPMHLAGPFVVIVGDEAAAKRFTTAEPIAPEAKEEYERELREKGLVSEVELLYSDLMRAIRASWLPPAPPA